MEDLWIHSLREMDASMEKILEDIRHWELHGNLANDEFFEHDIGFIKEILRSNNIAHQKKMSIEELLIPQHYLASAIVLSNSMRSEDFPNLIQKSNPISEDTKKAGPLWTVQFFTDNEYVFHSMHQIPKLRLRLVEAEKITDPETVHKFMMRYSSAVISSRIEGEFLKRSLKHPSLRKFFDGCYESSVSGNPLEDAFMVDFQLDYDGIRLPVLTDGANYYAPTLPFAPQFTSLTGLLEWLKVAKRESDERMKENRIIRLDSENNPNYPYAVMDDEDVALLNRNPFYSFKWLVEGNENSRLSYSSFPTDDFYPEYTYDISQLSYRVHTKNLVLNIPEMNEMDSRIMEVIDANMSTFKLAVKHGYSSSVLSVATYVKDPVNGTFEEMFEYVIADETSEINGEFCFSCDRIGFGEEHNTRVILEVEDFYPNKSFSELVSMVNHLMTVEIENQK